MDWTISIVFLIIGVIIGFVVSQLRAKNQDDRHGLETKLHQAQTELEQYRQDVADHFANSASLMKQMAADYNKVYQHMHQSQELLLPQAEQQASFAPELPADGEAISAGDNAEQLEDRTKKTSEQPNDYVRGSHGIINPAPEKTPEAVS